MWNKKGWFIAPNDQPCLYIVLNEKGNLIIRNHWHLIPTTEKGQKGHIFLKKGHQNFDHSQSNPFSKCFASKWNFA